MASSDPGPLDLLTRVPCFAKLPSRRLAEIAAGAFIKKHASGALIMQKGDRPSGLCVVATGTLKEVCHSSAGDERVIEILGPTQTCGEAALLLDVPLPFSVVALTGVKLLQIDRETFAALIAAEPVFIKSMLSALSIRIHALVGALEAYTMRAPTQRVAAYLAGKCDARDATPVVELPAAKTVVASRLGMSPEALSRAFRDLAAAGLVEVRGQRITVRDPGRLHRMAQ